MNILKTTSLVLLTAALCLTTAITFSQGNLVTSAQVEDTSLAMTKGTQKPPMTMLAMTKGTQKPPVAMLAMTKGTQKPPLSIA